MLDKKEIAGYFPVKSTNIKCHEDRFHGLGVLTYAHRRAGGRGGGAESDSNRQSAGIRKQLEKSSTVQEEVERGKKKT
jgi:hypothetical protein